MQGDVWAMRVVVSGRVQGVGFRWAAWREAERLGVSGHVRNEPDDTVTGVFEGPAAAVADMVAWCGHGPPGARVTGVAAERVPVTGRTGFRMG